MGLRFAENIMYYLVVIVSITYLKVQVGVDTNAILRYMLVAHAVHFAVIPLVGRLADRYGRRPVYFVGTVLAGTWGFFAFPMMNSGNYLDHRERDHHRPGHPRVHVRAATGDHGRDVPDPDAVFRCVPWLSGHVDRRGLAGAGHLREASRDLRFFAADRAVPGRGLGGHADRGLLHPRDQGHRPGRSSIRPTATTSPRRELHDGPERPHRRWSPAVRAGSARRARGSSPPAGRRSRSPTSTKSARRIWRRTSAGKRGRWTFSTSRRWRTCSSRPTSW